MARDAATFSIDFKLKIARRYGNWYLFLGVPFGMFRASVVLIS